MPSRNYDILAEGDTVALGSWSFWLLFLDTLNWWSIANFDRALFPVYHQLITQPFECVHT